MCKDFLVLSVENPKINQKLNGPLIKLSGRVTLYSSTQKGVVFQGRIRIDEFPMSQLKCTKKNYYKDAEIGLVRRSLCDDGPGTAEWGTR